MSYRKSIFIRIYSKDTLDKQREIYCKSAFQAHLYQEVGSAREVSKIKNSNKYSAKYEEFKSRMLSYLNASNPWYYEEVVRILYNLREQADKIKTVAKSIANITAVMHILCRNFHTIPGALH